MLSDQHSNDEGHTVGRFFDALTDDYTASIERCFPRYREMLWAVLDYLPGDHRLDSILELGCGTGNLSVLVAKAFPNSSLHVVDVSGESLEACRGRLGTEDRFHFTEQDFRRLDFDATSFDLVVSSIAIHHLRSEEKRSLFERVHAWLKPGGILAYADQCRGATSDLYQRHMDNWKERTFDAGSTEEEWDMWMAHQQQHDHHDPLVDQIDWLRSAGFSVVDCPWRYLLWSVIQARK